jgi:drug/metabolite transporter (DMT)-like permease
MTDEPPLSQRPDWRDQRRDERWRRREERWDGDGAWIGGTILIVLGVILLARNLGYFLPHNWWAVFLLIPAAGSFGSAWSMYQRNGRQMSAAVRGAAVGGVILVLLTFLFFIDFDWGKYWPVILILLGIAALGGSAWRR